MWKYITVCQWKRWWIATFFTRAWSSYAIFQFNLINMKQDILPGCWEFMGQDNLERLSNCNQDVSAHLRRYHLSKESLSEYDLICCGLSLWMWRLHNWKTCLCAPDIEAILEFTGEEEQNANILNIKAHKKELNVTEHSHWNWLRK
jgi:hypothetical protein